MADIREAMQPFATKPSSMSRLRPPEIIAPVRMEDLERGLQYLHGCLDLARRRNSDLTRDFAYMKKKIEASHRSNIDRGLRIAIDQAVSCCVGWTEVQDFERASAALDVALAALRKAAPRTTLPRIERRP